ncbi:MAG TPA: cation-translocating P-type ATPase [Oscillatoriaceae cyanobacterium]
MKTLPRVLIASLLALAPVATAGQELGATAPTNVPIPWCCIARSRVRELPTLPTPGQQGPVATVDEVRGWRRKRRPRRTDETPEAEAALLIDGLHCADCVATLERVLKRLPGVHDARVQLTTGRARVRFDAALVDETKLCEAIAAAGYLARPYDPGASELPLRQIQQTWLVRLAVTGFGAMATMFVAEALYGPMAPSALYASHAPAEAAAGALLRYAGLVVATATGGWGALPFLRGAWSSLRNKRAGMDTLISLGLIATYLASVWGFLTQGPVYFDSLLMFLFLLTLGRFAEATARRRVLGRSEHLLGASEQRARVLTETGFIFKAIDALRPDDRVEVLPGELFPADGVIVRGGGQVDESLLTGESLPVSKSPGDDVTGQTLNLDGALRVRVTRVGEASTFGRLSRLVQEAEGAKTHAQFLADRAGHWGTLGVLAIALATAVAWWFVSPSHAIPALAAVLIVTCPCALGLATPAALTLAVSRALGSGLLIRRAEALEKLPAVRHVVFDKTGTLTVGRPEARHLLGGPEALQAAATLESGSEHLLGRAILAHAQSQSLPIDPTPEDFRAVSGHGVLGTLPDGPAWVGSPNWLAEQGLTLPEEWAPTLTQWRLEGLTVVGVAWGGDRRGVIALGDEIREDAPALVKALADRGIGMTLLTGDNQGAAYRVAEALGIDTVMAEVTPEQKLEAVTLLKARYGSVAMVGDGLNDAPALAQADVGIALARGADLSVLAADVVVLNERLGAIAEAFTLSSRTLGVIYGNFKLSAAYNAIAIPLAALGLVNPFLAAVLMPLSSLAVLANTARLRRS